MCNVGFSVLKEEVTYLHGSMETICCISRVHKQAEEKTYTICDDAGWQSVRGPLPFCVCCLRRSLPRTNLLANSGDIARNSCSPSTQTSIANRMPEVTPFEMKRLTTIRDNHFLLKKLCGPGESVYEFQNSQALLDAALALRTGRLRTPSPPRSHTIDSSDDNIDDTNSRDPMKRRKKEATLLSAGETSVQAIPITDEGDIAAEIPEYKRVLRPRQNIHVASKQALGSSEEEEDTAAKSDEDYVVGSTLVNSFSESEAEEPDECEEEEYTDSDDETEVSEEPRVSKKLLFREVVPRVVSSGIDDGNAICNPGDEDHSVNVSTIKEGRRTTSKARVKELFKMDNSEENEHEKQGLETWTASTKSRRKPTSTKRVRQEEKANEKKNSTRSSLIPTRQPSEKSPIILQNAEQEVSRNKSGVGTTRRSVSEGTVVITEKEYRLLLSLQQKDDTVLTRNSNDARKADQSDGDDGILSKEIFSLRTEVGQPLKRKEAGLTAMGGVVELDINKRVLGMSKHSVHATPSPTNEVASKRGSGWKGKRKQLKSPEPAQDESSNSDFQKNPQRRIGTGHIVAAEEQHRMQLAFMKPAEKNVALHAALRAKRTLEGGNFSEKHSLQVNQTEPPSKRTGVKDILLSSPSMNGVSVVRRKEPTTRKNFFAFEKSMEENGSELQGVGGSAQCIALSDGDDDFQEKTCSDPGIPELAKKSVLTEAAARATRKRKKADRDVELRKRESAGQKTFYIMVNAIGSPYGDGLTAWKAELNKLSRALDPSIRDIRQQPHQKIEMLKKRLTDKFDYSGVISDKFLLPLLGQRVSARRNEIMNAIRAGRDRPTGVDEDAWRRLVSICGSPNFQRKSEAMRYANASRQNLGRTGPGGEIGVRDSLKEALRRSPDPEEVQAEMTRDKGYGGKKRKTKRMAVRERMGHKTVQCNDEGLVSHGATSQDLLATTMADAAQHEEPRLGGVGGNEDLPDRLDLMRRILDDIQVLKARVEASVS